MYPAPMPRGVMRSLSAACVLIAVASAPAAAQQISKQFREVWQKGLDAYNLGDNDEARTHFEKAAEFEPTLPGPYRYLADIARRESRFEDCLTLAEKAVTLNPRSEQFPQVQEVHERCREALRRPGFDGDFMDGGAIWVATEPDGARVRINGLSYGATPMDPRGFSTGPARVRVEREGYLPLEVQTQVVYGLVEDVVLELERDPDAREIGQDPNGQADVEHGWLIVRTRAPDSEILVAGEPPTRDAEGRIEADPGLHEVVVRAPGHEPWRRRVLIARGQNRVLDIELRGQSELAQARRKGWYGVGGAVALATAGTVFMFLERDAREEANDIWATETARPTSSLDTTAMFEPVRTREDLEDARSRGKTYGLASLLSYTAAAASLGAGIYYFIDARRQDREGFPAPLAVTPILPGDERGIGASVAYTAELDW
jgi:hypothetical protein